MPANAAPPDEEAPHGPPPEGDDDLRDTFDDPPGLLTTGRIGLLYRYRVLLGLLLALWIALLLGAGLFLSTLDVRLGAHIFGAKTWVKDEATVLRVGLRALGPEPSPHIDRVRAWLLPRPAAPDPQDWLPPTAAELDTAPAHTLSQRAGAFVQGRLPVTRSGPTRVHLRIDSPHGEIPPLDLDVHIEAAHFPLPRPTAQRPAKKLHPDEGPAILDLFPTDHVLPGSLPSALTVRATNAQGQPLQLPVELRIAEGHSALPWPAEVHTDAFGLAHLSVHSQSPRLTIALQSPPADGTRTEGKPAEGAPVDGMLGEGKAAPAPADHAPAEGTQTPAEGTQTPAEGTQTPAGPVLSRSSRRLQPIPTQYVLQLPQGPLSTQRTLPVQIQRLQHSPGLVFVDAWRGDRWVATGHLTVQADAQGRATGEFELPGDLPDPSVLWVQAYDSPYLPQQARGGRFVVHSAQPLAQIGPLIAQQWAAAGIDAAWAHALDAAALDADALRALLGRTARPDVEPTLLLDSTQRAEAQVAALKSRWQRRLLSALFVTSLLLVLGLTWVIRLSDRAQRRAWQAAGQSAQEMSLSTGELLRYSAPMVLILMLFLWGLMYVVLHLQW